MNHAPSLSNKNVRTSHDGWKRIELLRETLLSSVRHQGERDLTARQLVALLIVYSDDVVHCVSSMAGLLNVSRPGVTRILDRLVGMKLVGRTEDTNDRRRCLILRTIEGATYVKQLAEVSVLQKGN